PSADRIPLSHYWAAKALRGETNEAFDDACFVDTAIMDAKKAPRWLDMSRATNYAWHFDAAKVAAYLRDFAVTKQAVVHVQDEMTEVLTDERGFITALRTKSGQLLKGDLFIDCSGFRGLLINKAMEEPFVDMSDHLLCNSAVATAVPHDDEKNGVEPYTSSIAMPSGWTWKIPMLGRFGTGYVYSRDFTGQDEATLAFSKLWGLDPDHTEFNHVRFRVGRNRRAWVRNCVSVGLASCFVEPLESSGIYFIYAAIHMLAKHFPDKTFDKVIIDRFNREIQEMFDDTRDFLQAHYSLSPRTDTPFWQANKELVLADGIKDKIETYRAGLPVNLPVTDESTYYGNFEAEFRNFWTNGSYYCIFAGLGLMPRAPLPLLAYKPQSAAQADLLFADIKKRQRETADSLPSTYELLRQLHGVS
ncbi:tryptophan halogenase family protein, partial [Streptomyces sp. NPDC048845]